VRKLLGLVALLVGSPAVAGENSNPAFLGVGMHDQTPTGPCIIDTVTPDSGAHVAGIRPYDVITAIDGNPVTNCDGLVTAIQRHEPGVNVKIEVKRNGVSVVLESLLPSRADVLRKRFVGKPMPLPKGPVVRVEDQAIGDLAVRGKTTIVGMFDQRCSSCAASFSTIHGWAKGRGGKGSTISVVGVTAALYKSVPETIVDLKQLRGFDVPLLVADSDTFADLSITDNKRIHFLVVDPRGIVCYAAPLKPDADDKDAVLGELYAATEQAARRVR
jgi:membrane-associated protease RseP (regulator of RpoE activity)